jgi:hypothetical protein
VRLAAKPTNSKSVVINELCEESKDVCIWFFSGGIENVLDKYAHQRVQPLHSFEALRFLQQEAGTDEERHTLDDLAVRLVYMHAPEVVVTPCGMRTTPLASHKLYKQ